jgi:hypothetical protein
VAIEDKKGKPWSDEELDAIVADYFSMLNAELSGQDYVKSRHRAALVGQIGRTPGSVEFKHQNISAVLEELGMPRIVGYQPMLNYQDAIFGAIDRYLTANGDMVYRQPPPVVLHAAEHAEIFVDRPSLEPKANRPRQLERLIRKFDPVERDFLNRALGKAGEEYVLEVERKTLAESDRPDLARRVRWVSMEDGDGAGYDILSFQPDGKKRLIEVKTTNGPAKTPFFLTRNEHETSRAHPDSWQLYRVHLFAQTPRVFSIKPPLENALHLSPESWRATFG